MTENDKVELLKWLNKASEAMQHVYSHDVIRYFKLKQGWKEIIQELTKIAESRGYKVIWEGKKAVKIVEKGDKENEN